MEEVKLKNFLKKTCCLDIFFVLSYMPQSKYGTSEVSIAFISEDLSVVTVLCLNFSVAC